jgi:hypothetical protein
MMACEPSSLSEFVKFIGQVATIVFGWGVVHKLSASRDLDKSRREIVAKAADALSETADKLLLDARTYHLGDRSRNQEVQIIMALQDASIKTSALPSVCTSSSELVACRCAITSLKQAITSKHFEDEHNYPLDESDQQIQDIAAEVLRTKQVFMKLKHSQFA